MTFFDKVLKIKSVYTEEKHNTSRHLKEYIGVDFEIVYINSMINIMEWKP